MPDWMLPLITHGGLGAACAFLFFAWRWERAERIESGKLHLSLTREVVSHTAEHSRIAQSLGENIGGLAEKIDLLLSQGRRGR